MQVSRTLQPALNISRQIFIFICAALFMVTAVQAQDAPAADKPAGFAPESIEKVARCTSSFACAATDPKWSVVTMLMIYVYFRRISLSVSLIP